ncbi:MAG: hypothetical protein H0W44_05270 [Gammaproteobacteria bacterium]|nr:hypothetical protein [Gammaproteobacteria bacterium]
MTTASSRWGADRVLDIVLSNASIKTTNHAMWWVGFLSSAFFYLFLGQISTAHAANICNTNGGAGWTLTTGAPPNSATVNLPVTGGNSGYVIDANVSVNATHTWVGDLYARVTSPTSTNVILFDRPGVATDGQVGGPPSGCALDNFTTTFDDAGAQTLEAAACAGGPPVYNGTYKPHATPVSNLLSLVNGQNPYGTWQVLVDDRANNDGGNVSQACLNLSYAGAQLDTWVSTNASCSDQQTNLTVQTGENVYYCYRLTNTGEQAFQLSNVDVSNTYTLDLSGLAGTYALNQSRTVNRGPFAGGTANAPQGVTTPSATLTIRGNSIPFPVSQNFIATRNAALNVMPTTPAGGNKPLYFNLDGAGSPYDMSRVPRTSASTPASISIARNATPVSWEITPVLQASLSLATTPIPVVLQMRRDNNGSNRIVRAIVSYTVGVTTTNIGCTDLTIAGASLSTTISNEFTINVVQNGSATNCANPALGTPFTLPANAVVRVTIDNSPAGGGGQNILIYPYDTVTARTSRIVLPATTVINVDSVNTYNAAYAGGVITGTFLLGSTVYVRAVVSDPFGQNDVSAARVVITNPSGVTQLSIAMNEVAPLSPPALGAVKTFERSYTIPLSAPSGTWGVRVIADEGTEGTVSDIALTTFQVPGPILSILKLVSTQSDPVNGVSNPKAIPAAIMEYRVRVTNSGAAADTDSIVITDPIPSNSRFYFGAPLNPINFINGTPVSGLTFTFTSLASVTDDVAFSNNGGTSYVTPTIDGFGYDTTVPPINFIRINPKGVLSGDTGSGAPSFDILFRVRLQ